MSGLWQSGMPGESVNTAAAMMHCMLLFRLSAYIVVGFGHDVSVVARRKLTYTRLLDATHTTHSASLNARSALALPHSLSPFSRPATGLPSTPCHTLRPAVRLIPFGVFVSTGSCPHRVRRPTPFPRRSSSSSSHPRPARVLVQRRRPVGSIPLPLPVVVLLFAAAAVALSWKIAPAAARRSVRVHRDVPSRSVRQPSIVSIRAGD